MDKISLQDYYKKLRYNDWFYNYSDDPRAYRAGLASTAAVRALSNTSPEHKKLYDEYCTYIYSNGNLERPACPE